MAIAVYTNCFSIKNLCRYFVHVVYLCVAFLVETHCFLCEVGHVF
jgi:hypothetical protein